MPPRLTVAILLVVAACQPRRVTTPVRPAPTPRGPSATPGAPNAPGASSASGAPGAPATASAPPPAAAGPDPQPRPYAAIIPPRARSQRGIVGVHQVGSRLYFEIPRAQLGAPFLINTTMAGTAQPIGLDGTIGPQLLVRFERRDHRLFVRTITTNSVSTDTTRTTDEALRLIQLDPILAILPVDAYGADSAPVVDVTRLFTGGAPELSARGRRATVDPTRSVIDRVAVFPRNVNITATHTFTALAPPVPGAPPPSGLASVEAITFSMVRLPDVPMKPRLLDERVGYFGRAVTDFGSAEQRVVSRRYIARWRLECSERRRGALCEPVKPITYYVDPVTPRWLVPWIKRGIEAWQPAFEDAGFARAIVAADAPADSLFSGEDVTVSMVRWLPTAVTNAVGPTVTDPRSGEILDADVQMYHNIMDLQRTWYFTQVGHLDPRAQRFPLPDSLMGRLVEYVVAHEVGHTLGFPHNFRGSSAYPLDSLRAPAWVARMGHTPSIMDYARFNYVAQPSDRLALADLVPTVGPYDRFAVRWGYRPIPDAATPDAERPTLDRWARVQDTVPWLRFSGDNDEFSPDPGDLSEAVGDADAVRATGLGFRSLRQVMALVPGTVAGAPLSDNSLLRGTYDAVVRQWGQEAAHVTRIVGGSYRQFKVTGQPGPVFTPVPAQRQRDALTFLDTAVFATPTYLIDPALQRRIAVEGMLSRIASQQRIVLSQLLSPIKMQRLTEAEIGGRGAGMGLREMLERTRQAIWRELGRATPIDPFRRRLQLAYLDLLAARIEPSPQAPDVIDGPLVPPTDVRSLLKDELRELDRALARTVPRMTDRVDRAHLLEARAMIAKVLKVD